MPIYEYRCRDCGRVSGFLIMNLQEPFTPVCRGCGRGEMERVLSRVNVRLSEDTRLERLADPGQWSGLDENNPKEVAGMLKKMGREMGEDFPGEMDQLVEEAMADRGKEGGESDFD